MEKVEQTLDSREVAEMTNKEHKNLLRDINRYVNQFNELNIEPVDFFQENTYKDAKGEVRPCYRITKKGCEFIAHKLTGTKGTEFTARYINRFHEMQDIISNPVPEPDLPWFIRKFQGRYIILERDFIQITGINIKNHKSFYKEEFFTHSIDFDGYGWMENNQDFREKYGFDYGDDACMMYLYPSGVIKALNILMNDPKNHMIPGAYKVLTEGLHSIHKICEIDSPAPTATDTRTIMNDTNSKNLPININISFK